jgi:hypothetical protein
MMSEKLPIQPGALAYHWSLVTHFAKFYFLSSFLILSSFVASMFSPPPLPSSFSFLCAFLYFISFRPLLFLVNFFYFHLPYFISSVPFLFLSSLPLSFSVFPLLSTFHCFSCLSSFLPSRFVSPRHSHCIVCLSAEPSLYRGIMSSQGSSQAANKTLK